MSPHGIVSGAAAAATAAAAAGASGASVLKAATAINGVETQATICIKPKDTYDYSVDIFFF